MIDDPDTVCRRALQIVSTGRVTATNGAEIALRIDTLCTHGDTRGAGELTRRLREALETHGVTVSAPGARASHT